MNEEDTKILIKCLEELPALQRIQIPDASKDGYACTIYSRTKTEEGIFIRLLAARGRVTPPKTKINQENPDNTIPKMELESIVLMAELLQELKPSFNKLNIITMAYTDSMVALNWIKNQKASLPAVVKRKIKKIIKAIEPENVHHCISEGNPADAGSRGQNPTTFITNKLWLEGPEWLKADNLPVTTLENNTITTLQTTPLKEIHPDIEEIIRRYSSTYKLIRIVNKMRRWLPSNSYTGPLTFEETLKAKIHIIKLQQAASFGPELRKIKNGQRLHKHWMTSLNPFIDPVDGILKVGGRLGKATWLSASRRHPILLQKKGALAELIINDAHYNKLHASGKLMEQIIKEEYWIPSIKLAIKSTCNKCAKCLRYKPNNQSQIMADLPENRLNPAPTFGETGVEACGPFMVKTSNLRNLSPIKH